MRAYLYPKVSVVASRSMVLFGAGLSITTEAEQGNEYNTAVEDYP